MTVTEEIKGRRYRGVSEEVRRTERRQRFIEAGLDVFAERGYHSSTVRSICASAGLTERYFYESFSNSEDLLTAVYKYTVKRLRESTISTFSIPSTSADAMIEAALNSFLTSIHNDPRLARILFVEVLGVSARIDTLYRQAVEEFAGLLNEISQSVVTDQAPMPDRVKSDLLALGLVGAVINLTARWVVMDFKTPQEELVATLKHIFMAVHIGRGGVNAE
ncbi:MAG: TetR/AcrR family transcriptional regulator [Moraxellaceae bacterium]|nr:TetR/AcrR family transcriptional regulator [Moraxellaceae bacterium]MDZ4297352.1 TetR/AcrR family transcriptional regulator [Moraxellaceae bacterium]MDZ4386680.1 TetR/AcrR family transcriptional regulator [Moraxellaceae bacterium]